jgi:hypothetical protein
LDPDAEHIFSLRATERAAGARADQTLARRTLLGIIAPHILEIREACCVDTTPGTP